ncbi:uncharacterized protein [Nicotiana sylvestris]|uniref:uncharacterized protein n=1 Tax=Nicotiana sylvestris TaxID=4096 RepID=UPI00388C383D
MSQCEAELRNVSGEEKALRLLCSRKEEELKDLRAELAKARKNKSELDEQVTMILKEYGLLGSTSEAKTSISQLQQKLDMIGQLRGEVDQVKVDYHRWKESMDQLAADKEVATAQLASVETQVRGVKAKGLAQTKKKEEDAAAIQAELREASDREKQSNDLAKCQALRETLKEIHARGFDLAEDIAEAKAREIDARFLVSSDDEDVVSGSGEGEEDVPEGEEAPEDRAAEDAAPEDGGPGDMTPTID